MYNWFDAYIRNIIISLILVNLFLLHIFYLYITGTSESISKNKKRNRYRMNR